MNAQDKITAYWSGHAPAYDAYQQRPERLADNTRAWSAVWRDALGEEKRDVLDVGTGTGHAAMILAALGHRVTGIDLADGMLAEARRHAATVTAGPEFMQGDAVAPDFPPASFDAIAARYVMWTLREPEVAVANWMRLLRPGGIIAVVDSTWHTGGLQASTDRFAAHYDAEVGAALPLAEAASIDDTAAVLDRAGLTDVTVTPLLAIYELDEKYGVAPGHQIQMQYAVTGLV
ncbi:class I SAM-dependent methyltransferase [Actinoplanes sp. NBRC 103695]|uniref:class I SAM-dependent methyltransferase n=1 Tax=Actinoplanes sp. NBRC 103695 TaxID=3032202 RepID=UPI0024A255FD|nr:class I SAM-dependent methyltransferase [Actinoplanes sp. NBRC 103695]GLZ01595.1 SAM-dependent methyltransferase [Actinoplanes sp. NBRC 103695]